MWLLRLLNGPQAGQTYRLTMGVNKIGRTTASNITLNHPGISKDHAVITVTEDKIVISDNNSRNGTFINGVKIQNRRYQPGEKISFHEVVCEIISEKNLLAPQNHSISHVQIPNHSPSLPLAFPNSMPQAQNDQGFVPAAFPASASPAHSNNEVPSFFNSVPSHFQKAVIQPLVHLSEKYDFSHIHAVLLAMLVTIATLLAVIPHMHETSSNLHSVGMRSALNMAKQLAEYNRGPVSTGQQSVINTQFIQLQDGVKKVFIVDDRTGDIIAPIDQAGHSTEYAFVHRARRDNKEVVADLEGDVIGASAPIISYSLKLGTNDVIAHAVVLYDASHLSVSDSQSLGLFVQSLFLAFLVATLFFIIISKWWQQSVETINREIDKAMRDSDNHITIRTLFPPFKDLETKINSLLNLSQSTPSSSQQPAFGMRKEVEAENLVHLVGFPAMAIKAETLQIIAINQPAQDLLRVSSDQLHMQSIDSLNDQALKLNIRDLIDKSQSEPAGMISNAIDFQGNPFNLTIQVIFDSGVISYYLVVVLPGDVMEEVG